MLPRLLLLVAAFFPFHGGAATLVTAPQRLPADDGRPVVFLAGSIDNGTAADWQQEVINALSDLDVVLLNPRRTDWNPAWQSSPDEPEFVRQVRWELQGLEQSDVVLMYFAPGSQSPVTLLEFGLHARHGNVLVAAPEGFWRKANVDITADHYSVPRFASLTSLIEATRMRINTLRPARK